MDGRGGRDARRSPPAPRIIFTYKMSAVALLGPFDGHGLRPGRPLAGAEVFVMPGPMEARGRVGTALGTLREWWEG